MSEPINSTSVVQGINPKPKWKSKTLWIGFATVFLGALQASVGDAPIDPKIAGFVAMGLGAAIAVLRKFTDAPLA